VLATARRAVRQRKAKSIQIPKTHASILRFFDVSPSLVQFDILRR
jgi:hypothetical protein